MGSNPCAGKSFSALHARPERLSGPSSLLYHEYHGPFSELKSPGHGAEHHHPPPSTAEVK